jgi:hypothetical protein
MERVTVTSFFLLGGFLIWICAMMLRFGASQQCMHYAQALDATWIQITN